MKKGEDCVIYHSNTGKAAVGLAKVVSVALAEDGKTHPRHPKSRQTP